LGLVWILLRLLESASLAGVRQLVVSNFAAMVFALPVLRNRLYERIDWKGLLLVGTATGWCNLAFVLAMLGGMVVRVKLMFYQSSV
jgi:hypothetical protein